MLVLLVSTSASECPSLEGRVWQTTLHLPDSVIESGKTTSGRTLAAAQVKELQYARDQPRALPKFRLPVTSCPDHKFAKAHSLPLLINQSS